MGRQFPVHVGGDDFFLDLLFYHTRLRCYVVVELKDQPSIGILLCKTPNKVIVEYSLENIASPLGVAEYKIMRAVPDELKGELPSIEELERELGEPVAEKI